MYPTPFIAKDVDELREDLEKVHINSLCFHIFEPKLRYQRRENDFSAWLRNIGEEKLADQISRLDPYAFTLEGLRQKIIRILGRDD